MGKKKKEADPFHVILFRKLKWAYNFWRPSFFNIYKDVIKIQQNSIEIHTQYITNIKKVNSRHTIADISQNT